MAIHNNFSNIHSANGNHHAHRNRNKATEQQADTQTADIQSQSSLESTLANDLSSLPELASLFGKNAQGQTSDNYSSMMSSIIHLIMTMVSQLFSGNQDVSGSTTTNTDDTSATTNNDNADNNCQTNPPSNCDGTPEEPPVTPPCTDEPPTTPPETSNDVLGSAGLFGDPKFGVFTPNLGDIPEALKSFESGIKAGETKTLLSDTDEGGLEVTGTGIQVDPANTASTGIGSASFKAGNDTVTIGGDGSLVVNGEDKGNINNLDSLDTITLDSGLKIGIDNEVDSADGTQGKRFVIANGEYKITAAARKPAEDSAGYLDMNFEELTPDAASNADGYHAPVDGIDGGISLADLLNLKPGDLQNV